MEELKYGYWIPINRLQGNETDGFWSERYLQCSVCNYERRHSWLRAERPKYCEECGSDMRGEQQ